MAQTPIVFIPGLLCSAELFAPQVVALWPHGPVHLASTLEGSTMAGMASSILASAPPTFALVGLSLVSGPEVFSRHQEAIIARSDSRPSLGRIAVPTLVLVGESDQLTPPDLAKEVAEAIPGARLEVIPECGHLSTLDQPEAVTQALIRWITDF